MTLWVPRFLQDLFGVDLSGASPGDVLTIDADGESVIAAAPTGGGVGSVPFVGDDPPPSPEDGDLWWDTDDDTESVVAAADVSFTPNGSIAATNVQAAIQEVRDEAGSGSVAAADVTIADAANDFTATDVEGALAELQSDAEADATALSDHIADATAAHAGTAISNTPAGTVAATTVQAAINELDTEKAAASHTHAESDVTGLVSDLAGKVAANGAITGATKTKVTYDAKGLVTAGADATTADIADSSNKRYVTDAQLTVIGNTSGTNTGDQTSVTGNAGTATALATPRNIDGQAFDGTAAITVIAPGTHAATGKTTPVDADELPLVDSAASNVLKKLTWANLKATLKTYFDTLYSAVGAYAPGGTDVALADGGTGASLADPNADRIMFWDDSAGSVAFLTPGTGLSITGTTIDASGGGGGAPTTATYITQTSDGTLSNEQAMGSLATGLVKNTTTTGVQSIAAEGTDYWKPGGTDVAVADGGTGASTAATARTNLGAAASGLTRKVRVRLDTPDSSGNAYPGLSTAASPGGGFSNVRRIVPAFVKDVDGSWEGSVEIPQDYASGGAIIISLVANATSGVFRHTVGTAVVADGVSEDTAYTTETAVDTTVPGTARLRKDISVTLTTTPVAGSTLNVKITHAGAHANDTLAVDALIWDCHFSYVSV